MENKGERVFDEDIAARIIKHSKSTALNADSEEKKKSANIDSPFRRRTRREFPTGILVVTFLLAAFLVVTTLGPRKSRKKGRRRGWF